VPRTRSARTMRAIPTSARAPEAKGAGWCGLHGTEVVLPRVFCDFSAKQARIFTDTRGVVTQRRRGRRSFSRLQGWSVGFGWRREVAVSERPAPSGRLGGRASGMGAIPPDRFDRVFHSITPQDAYRRMAPTWRLRGSGRHPAPLARSVGPASFTPSGVSPGPRAPAASRRQLEAARPSRPIPPDSHLPAL
jgi:hypothetical protein